jgi:hypothetical protein
MQKMEKVPGIAGRNGSKERCHWKALIETKHLDTEKRMSTSRVLSLVAAVAVGLLPVVAQAAPIQKYGEWKTGKENYTYRTYTFAASEQEKPTVHVVIYYKDDPKHYYYWNPKEKKFWGRGLVDSVDGCHQLYQMLAPEDRKGDLADIPKKAFPPPTETPKLSSITPGLDPVDAKDDKLALPADKPPPAFLAKRG